jgi:uncharacterized RDD family membrane protein YckC
MNEKSVETVSRKPAGFFSRTLALVVDLFLLAILGLMSGVVIFLVIYFFNIDQILRFWVTLLGIDSLGGQFTALISPILFLVVLSYFVFFWSFVGYTPGKALFGLCIVRQDGQPLSFRRALVRYLCYWVSALPFFLGFIWVLFDRQHEGWHDKIADTHVIYRFEDQQIRKTLVENSSLNAANPPGSTSSNIPE